MKNPSLLRPDKKKMYLDKVNEAQNFFKHSGRDSNKSYDFNPESTEFFIWDTCRMYHAITTEFPKNQFIFNSWFTLKNPDIMLDPEMQENLVKGKQLFNMNSRSLFFKEMSELYELNNQ